MEFTILTHRAEWLLFDFPDMDAAMAHVETMYPLRRGWTGRWLTPTRFDGHPNLRARVYARSNSRGRPQQDILVSEGRHWRAHRPA